MKYLKALVFVVLHFIALTNMAHAEIKERRTFIPVQVTLQSGEVIKRDMELVIFEDDAAKGQRPVVVFGHGKPPTGQSISTWGWVFSHRAGLSEFVRLGYTVIFPMRIGQGGTGGSASTEDPFCAGSAVAFTKLYDLVASQMIQAGVWAKSQKEFDGQQIIYAGQSMGGSAAIAIASAAENPFSVSVNFAGGPGGDHTHPCSPNEYRDTVANYAAAAKIPLLWIQGKNDHLWADHHVETWSTAYKTAGGVVDFYLVSANTPNGHDLFRKSPEIWVPIAKRYLSRQGLLPTANGALD